MNWITTSNHYQYEWRHYAWFNSTPYYCLSLREVNHVMQPIEVINYDSLSDDDPLLIQALKEIKDAGISNDEWEEE